VFGAEVSDPVPGEHALYSDHDVLTERSYDAEKCFWVRSDVLMNLNLASAVKDTDIHFLSMKVDSTIILVLFGVKSHWASSF